MSTAEIIQTNKENILSHWMEKLENTMPIIKKYEKSAIQNSVPDLIDAIVKNLDSEDIYQIKYNSRMHGYQRASFKNYSLRHIVKEYNYLKAEILHCLDQNQVLSPKDRDAIIFVMDQAIEQATETFHIAKQGVHIKALEIAEKKADELQNEDNNREEYILSISHDLNSPLNNIKGCINLLEMDLEVGEVSKILKILKASSDRAESLIKDFIDVGKIKIDEKFPIHKSKFNLAHELENEISVYEVSRNREIKYKTTDKDIIAEIDLDLLRRAIGNLLNNAIKYGNKETPIVVSTSLEGNDLVIEVKNFGNTIPKEVQDNIFNRFYQAEGKGKGWGIGLAFVKEVVKAHNGSVSVESTEEKGTIFKLVFPNK